MIELALKLLLSKALPLSMCPYNESKCIPFPGVEPHSCNNVLVVRCNNVRAHGQLEHCHHVTFQTLRRFSELYYGYCSFSMSPAPS